MSAEFQTKVQASPAQNFTPVRTGILQRKCTLCNIPRLTEDSKQDKEKLTLQRSSVEPRFGHDFSRVQVHDAAPTTIQTKLTIGQPNDRYEREADRVAEQVIRMQEPAAVSFTTPHIQRACPECEEKEELLQTKEISGQNAETTPDLESRINDIKGGGQPLSESERAFYEPRFGYDFSQVRVHTGTQAAEAAREVNARAFTMGRNLVFGGGQYAPGTTRGRRLLAHELTHVLQQSAVPHRQVLMRDLAQEPPSSVPEQPELTATQVRAAIRYNRASYNEESTRLIQDIVGGPQTGRFEEQTVRLVALIQRQFGLVRADGKVGPDTYDFLIRELQAENVTPGTCLTMFQVVGPQPLAFFRNSPTRGTIGSRFEVHARFDPRCNCGDFEYRQSIGGHVELLEDSQPGVTPPARSGCAVLDSVLPDMWVWNMDECFQIPGGGLRRRMREDGDTGVATGLAGRRYGHRSARPNPADNRDQYLPDRATGCIYEAFDVPEIAPVPATPGDSGDVYDWDVRFRGVIQHSDGTIVAEKWWNIIATVDVP